MKNIYLIYSGVAVVILFIIYGITDKAADIFSDTEEDKKKKKEAQDATNFINDLFGLNWVNGTLKNYLVKIPKSQGFDLAKQRAIDFNKTTKPADTAEAIDKAAGINADEAAIYGALTSLKTQLEVSIVSDIYYKLYKTSLFKTVVDSFNDEELINLYKNLKNKPLI